MDAYIPVGADLSEHVQIQLIHGDICCDDAEAVGIYRMRGDCLSEKDDRETETPSSARKFAEGLLKGEILGVKLPGTPFVSRKSQEEPIKGEMFTVKLPDESPLPVKKTAEYAPASARKSSPEFKDGNLQVKLPDTSSEPMKFVKRNLLGGFRQTKQSPQDFAKPTETSLELWKIAGEQIETQFRTVSSKGGPFVSRGVVMTSGGNLRQKRIFHLLVSDDPDKLQETVLSTLRLAEKERIGSISFPALPMVLQHGTNIRNIFNTFEEFARQDHPNFLRFIRVIVSETGHEMPSYMNAREVHELQLYRNVMVDTQKATQDTEAEIERSAGEGHANGATAALQKSPKVTKHEIEYDRDNSLHEYIEMTEYGPGHVKLPSDYSEMDTVQLGRPLSDFDSQTVSQTIDSQTLSSSTTSDSSDSSSSSSSSSSSESSGDDSEDEGEDSNKDQPSQVEDEPDSGGPPRVIADIQLPSIPVSRLDLDPLQIGAITTVVTRVHNSGNINQALINFASPEDNLGGTEIIDGVTKISVGSKTMFNITLSNDPGKFPRLRTMIQATLREANRDGFRQVSLPGNAVSSHYIQTPHGWSINPEKIYPLLCFQAINDFALYDYDPAILNSIHIVVDDRKTLDMYDQVRKVFENFHDKSKHQESIGRRPLRKNKDMCCRWYCYWRIFTFGWDFTVEFNHPDSYCCCCCSQEDVDEAYLGRSPQDTIRNRVGSPHEQQIVSSFL